MGYGFKHLQKEAGQGRKGRKRATKMERASERASEDESNWLRAKLLSRYAV